MSAMSHDMIQNSSKEPKDRSGKSPVNLNDFPMKTSINLCVSISIYIYIYGWWLKVGIWLMMMVIING